MQSRNFIQIFGLPAAGLAVSRAFTNEMAAVVESRILLSLLDRLTVQDQNTLLALIDHGDNIAKKQFLIDRVPDAAALVDREIRRVQDEIHEYARA